LQGHDGFYTDTTKQLKNEIRGFGTLVKFKEKGRYILIPEISTKEEGIEINTILIYRIKSIK